MNPKDFIQKLTQIGERQLQNETIAATLIEETLVRNGLVYTVQEFSTSIPEYIQCSLLVDDEPVQVLPSGLVSGTITDNFNILSSLISSQKNLYDANINFNPACPYISRSNHYFAPAFSIARTDVQKVACASKVKGTLEVTQRPHTSKNILVGNTKNPTTIIFSHYDSISVGAVDNASGTALSLDIMIENKDVLNSTLFVLCGNEELSFDEKIYWGRGYRCFEQEHSGLLENASKILILDSLGHTLPIIFTDIRVLTLAFPLADIQKYAPKTTVIAGDIPALMEFYHAENDVPENIQDEYYEATKVLVYTQLHNGVV